MARTQILLLICLFFCFSVETRAQEPLSADIFVVAELRSVTLTRRELIAERRERELRRELDEGLGALPADDPDTETAIIISTHCGEARALFHVRRSTQPIPAELVIDFSIGEFCEPPIAFEERYWLLAVDPSDKTVIAHYPIFNLSDESLYAFSEFGPHGLGARPEATQRLLTPAPLPQALEYGVGGLMGDRLRRFVDRRASLELRDERAWLVSAIPLEAIFPGLTRSSLEEDD